MAALELHRAQALAFRAMRHGLAARKQKSELADVVGVTGIRRTKNATLSLAARLHAIAPDDLTSALDEERLAAFYGARGAVMIAPLDDVPVFTVGTAPADEASLRAAIPGAFVRQLDGAGISAGDALEAVIDAVRHVLADGPRPRGETAMGVTRALPRALTPPCRGRCPDPHVEDSLFRLAGVNGAMRFHRSDDVLVAASEGGGGSRSTLRTAFVRRYLSCYGPSKPDALAAWAGISDADARRSLGAISGDVIEVGVDGNRAGVMLRVDGPVATSAAVQGTRFLPPFDPYLLDRDRAMLVPARAAQKLVWRSSGNPGVVVVDAEPVATWRTRKHAGRTGVVIEPFDPAAPLDSVEIEEESRRTGRVLDGEAL